MAAPVLVAAASAAVAAIGISGRTDLIGAAYGGCPIRLATGLDCPGCGGTRALLALGRGDVRQALDHNLLLVGLIPAAAAGWWRWVRASLRGQAPAIISERGAVALLAVTALFGILRNLDRLSWLASSAL